MKKVVAGCIDLMLEFASVTELDKYIASRKDYPFTIYWKNRS